MLAVKDEKRQKKRSAITFLKKWGPIYLLMLPGLVYLLINNYIPMSGIVVAFKQYNVTQGIFHSPWVGFNNFTFLFQTSDAFIITRNTILYNLLFIVVNTVLGIIIAIFISEATKNALKKLYQSSILLPFLMSIVVVSYMVFAFLSVDNGMLNKWLLPLFGKEPVSWYNEPKYWPLILVLVNIWKGIGFSALMYVAAITGIDRTLFESAEIDGAGKLRQIFSITLPLLVPTVITLTLLSIGKIFYADFGLFYQVPMDSGSLYDVTNVIDTYVYRALLQIGNIGMSSAAGVYQSVVGFVLVFLSNFIVRKINAENALF
jgi:putative aldouronate transport system permease protein